MLLFKKEKLLTDLPFPQVGDPTNCVLYCMMNLFNDDRFYDKYQKDKGGHDEKDEMQILNNEKDIIFHTDSVLFQRRLGCNGGSVYDGLSISQLQRAFEFWDHQAHDESTFVPVFLTVASQSKMYGLHRILVLYDGQSPTKNARLILCDPQISKFVILEGIHEVVAKYRIINDVEIMSFASEKGYHYLHFSKAAFSHIPFDALDKEEED